MANRWGKVEAVKFFIFLGPKTTAYGDCSHEIFKNACSLEEKLMTNLDSVLKSREIADKGLYRQGYGLPSAHVQL